MGCINRDKNAVYNIEKIFNHYINYKNGKEEHQRPLVYIRDYTLNKRDEQLNLVQIEVKSSHALIKV